jgi:8-oxo-dGTP diphosphatase
MSSAPTLVVAAVIERAGQVLIGQRKAAARHALKWEFPGGKVEPGEEPRAALARELREELGIDSIIGEEIDAYQVQYTSEHPTQLIFYRVTSFSGEPENLDFEQIVWEWPLNLPEYDFLEGDVRFVARLSKT